VVCRPNRPTSTRRCPRGNGQRDGSGGSRRARGDGRRHPARARPEPGHRPGRRIPGVGRAAVQPWVAGKMTGTISGFEATGNGRRVVRCRLGRAGAPPAPPSPRRPGCSHWWATRPPRRLGRSRRTETVNASCQPSPERIPANSGPSSTARSSANEPARLLDTEESLCGPSCAWTHPDCLDSLAAPSAAGMASGTPGSTAARENGTSRS
jgi:hypothetical protein